MLFLQKYPCYKFIIPWNFLLIKLVEDDTNRIQRIPIYSTRDNDYHGAEYFFIGCLRNDVTIPNSNHRNNDIVKSIDVLHLPYFIKQFIVSEPSSAWFIEFLRQVDP